MGVLVYFIFNFVYSMQLAPSYLLYFCCLQLGWGLLFMLD